MPKLKESSVELKSRPPISTEAQENKMISLAMDCAEKQLKNGTASSQVITHFLKLGTSIAQLEKEKIRNENLVLEAKAKQIATTDEVKILCEEAIKAMKNYSGHGNPEEYEDD